MIEEPRTNIHHICEVGDLSKKDKNKFLTRHGQYQYDPYSLHASSLSV